MKEMEKAIGGGRAGPQGLPEHSKLEGTKPRVQEGGDVVGQVRDRQQNQGTDKVGGSNTEMEDGAQKAGSMGLPVEPTAHEQAIISGQEETADGHGGAHGAQQDGQDGWGPSRNA